MHTVLDFAGLSSEQLDHASPLIGGSLREVIPLKLPAGSDVTQLVTKARPGSGTVIVQWGAAGIDDLLTALHQSDSFRSWELALVLLDRIWIFHMIARDNEEWDEDTEEFIPRDFDPKRYYNGTNVMMVPWERDEALATMQVFLDQNLHGIPLFVELKDYFLHWHMATAIRELTADERHEPEQLDPWPPPVQYDRSFEQGLGWSEERFCDEFAIALLTPRATEQEHQWLRLMQHLLNPH